MKKYFNARDAKDASGYKRIPNYETRMMNQCQMMK